jgi:hypothetical protein
MIGETIALDGHNSNATLRLALVSLRSPLKDTIDDVLNEVIQVKMIGGRHQLVGILLL